MRYALGERLIELETENTADIPSVFLTTSSDARNIMKQAGMIYEGELNLSEVGFCKLETQQECLAGSFCIPKLLDVLGNQARILGNSIAEYFTEPV